MEEIIFLKNKKASLWESNPHLAFGIYLIFYLILLFGSIVVTAFGNIPGIVLVVWLILMTIMFLVLIIHLNQVENMSKSTAFIKKNDKLYSIQLLYTKEIETKTSKTNVIYAPSGTVLQGATLPNNIEVAANVQSHEQEVRDRRKNAESFIIALDDILDYLKQKPEKYKVLANSKRSRLDNVFKYNIENNGMVYIGTKKASYNFLILNNPRVTKQSKRNFVIEFYNENNELCTAKFTNCFGNIIEEIT